MSDSDESYTYIHSKDAYIHTNTAYIHKAMSRSLATVEHPITKHCPILTGGDTTPQTLLILENAFNEFFIAKNVTPEDQVKVILGAFKCVHIRDWIATDREHILTLTFEEFMADLRKNSLPSDWVETVRMTLLGMRMTKNMHFWDFAQDVRALNIVLRGTSSHMDNSLLHNQLEAGLEPALQAECSREGLCAVTALKDWIEHVKKVDERLTFDRKRSSLKNLQFALPNAQRLATHIYQTHLRPTLQHILAPPPGINPSYGCQN
jgi:hypothetical protein